MTPPTLSREIPFKQWLIEEQERTGVLERAIYKRIAKGQIKLKRRSVNRRVVFVEVAA